MTTQHQCKKRVKYSPDAMLAAINGVRTGAMSRTAACRMYGVPKTTLLDKLAGRVPEDPTPIGRKPILTMAEERKLVDFTLEMCSIGYPLSRNELLGEVKKIIDIDGRQTPFKDNIPGKDWFRRFTLRHPEVTLRKPMSLGHERAQVTMEKIQGWYAGVKMFLQKEIPNYEELLSDPRRIFNADESGFPLQAKGGRVLAPAGARHVYQVVTNNTTQITVMAGFNAYGEYTPPMILFPGERIRDVGLAGFPEAIYAATPNGRMTPCHLCHIWNHCITL